MLIVLPVYAAGPLTNSSAMPVYVIIRDVWSKQRESSAPNVRQNSFSLATPVLGSLIAKRLLPLAACSALMASVL
jgi:hypothetical protein